MALAMPPTIPLVFGLLVAIVVLATLAARLRLPYAILLVLGGLLLSFLPGLPDVTIDPTLILFVFLPPLIYSSAWNTSWREFRATLWPLWHMCSLDSPGRSPSCWVRLSHQRMPSLPARRPGASDFPDV